MHVQFCGKHFHSKVQKYTFLQNKRMRDVWELETSSFFLIWPTASKVIGEGGHPTPHPIILKSVCNSYPCRLLCNTTRCFGLSERGLPHA